MSEEIMSHFGRSATKGVPIGALCNVPPKIMTFCRNPLVILPNTSPQSRHTFQKKKNPLSLPTDTSLLPRSPFVAANVAGRFRHTPARLGADVRRPGTSPPRLPIARRGTAVPCPSTNPSAGEARPLASKAPSNHAVAVRYLVGARDASPTGARPPSPRPPQREDLPRFRCSHRRQGEDLGQRRNPSGPAASNLHGEAAGERAHPGRLQHPEGVDPPLGAPPPRRHHRALPPGPRPQVQPGEDDLPQTVPITEVECSTKATQKRKFREEFALVSTFWCLATSPPQQFAGAQASSYAYPSPQPLFYPDAPTSSSTNPLTPPHLYPSGMESSSAIPSLNTWYNFLLLNQTSASAILSARVRIT